MPLPHVTPLTHDPAHPFVPRVRPECALPALIKWRYFKAGKGITVDYLIVVVSIGFALTLASLYWIGSTLEKIAARLKHIE
jgi:hypothetical protein